VNGWSTPRPGRCTPGKDPVPIQEAGWAPGPVWTGAKNLTPPTGIRSPDRPARSKSLYRLCYPGPPTFFFVSYLKDHVLFAINNQYTIATQDYTYIFLLVFFKPAKYTRSILPASVFFCVLALDHDLFCVFQCPSGFWHLITTSVLPLI